jgi:competence CoiA-like predicted nuclease
MVEAHEGSSRGPIVNIRNADKDRSYYCIGRCDDEVRPVQGSKMPWHYRHRENPDCPYLQAHQGEGLKPE